MATAHPAAAMPTALPIAVPETKPPLTPPLPPVSVQVQDEAITSVRRFHQKSGLTLRTLCDAPDKLINSTISVYCGVQSGGPVISKLGFSPAQITAYATFMITSAARHPWNVVAVDNDGEAQGMYLALTSLENYDEAASHLPPPAKKHWSIFRAIESAFKERVPGLDRDTIGAVIGCATKQYQGCGLYPALSTMCADLAEPHGYTSLWSWTHNPLLVQAIGKTDGGASIISRAAEYFFRVSPAISNGAMIPAARLLGLLPQDRVAFFVDRHRFRALSMFDNNVLLARTPLVTTRATRARGRGQLGKAKL